MSRPPVPSPLPESGPLRGLREPWSEHDGCGVACVARLDGEQIHEVIERALVSLDNLEHRGAAGADETTGDGAGILIQLPHGFLREVAEEFGVAADRMPRPGRVAIAVCFLPRDGRREELERLIAATVSAEGQVPLGWRTVPVDERQAGRAARVVAPRIRQLLIEAGPGCADQDAFERKLFVIRRELERSIGEEVYFPSFSSRTLVYKGMLSAPQLARFYADLEDPRLGSALAIVHSRFSTNTFPSWALAHPYRMIAHNGEINTLAGNVNWMRAREAALSSPAFGDELRRCLPLIPPGSSDSATFDRVLELLVLAGRPLAHAAMMMIPRAYERRAHLAPELADFYRYHSRLIEPWDGPASVTFSDGRVLGAMLDRNGLRPGRWLLTDDGWVALASEAGAFPIGDERIARKGRLHPGRLFIADLERGRLLEEREAELEVARRRPYGRWYAERTIGLADLPDQQPTDPGREPLRRRQLAFGFTQEDLRTILAPMARAAKEPTGSMGADAALAVLSDRQPSLFSYYKQTFAQITNPAIDPVREDMVMSLESGVGPQGNLLRIEDPDDAHQVALEQPVLLPAELERLRHSPHPALSARTIDITWPVADGARGMTDALRRICFEASEAIVEGSTILILSDRRLNAQRVPIPSLLGLGAVHHHLVRAGTRLSAGLVVESGEPREVHHVAALIGYGAAAVSPYLMFESLAGLDFEADLGSVPNPERRVVDALGAGLLKVMSKMGISTINSYCGAQIFEAVGLDRELVDRHFAGTPSRIGGVGVEALAREALARHARAYPESHGLSVASHVGDALLPAAHEELLPQGGLYAWRRDGERHMWDPPTIAALQRAVRDEDEPGGARGAHGRVGEGAVPGQEHPDADVDESGPSPDYDEFAYLVNEENARRGMLRGLMRLREGEPVPLAEVEPAAEIVRRFCTGGMSLGALSPEAHETLAVAMNRLGAKSNSGEGGEDSRRYEPDPNGDWRRSAIKQVASGRFGVTAHYLANAEQLQIKISQGSKPGEGGQLPGHKVDAYIARLRHSTPGVELISPPPHHDIYSIEDLKQLVYDLRTANPDASVSVKLAAEVGVGTVAAGVAKAGADHVVIAGHDGGTGASPLSSIQSAGVPWELGLAETQQTLLENGLRSRIVVQADGQMRTGRDVVVAALLGADEVGFSTAPLIATGCIMMRVCHLNTCPVGVASQDPELRRRFTGRPEHVVRYLIMVAEEVRRAMAGLGVRSFEELIGRAELLEADPAVEHWKARGVDLSRVLSVPDVDAAEPRRFRRASLPSPEELDPLGLLPEARPALERGEAVRIERRIGNVHRAIGGSLSHAITSAHGPEGLPEGTVRLALRGSAGQSLGAWLAAGIEIELHGEANDYVGKGLSGGLISIQPPPEAAYEPERNVIAGNVALYGATEGRLFVRGIAGERFAVRNSGALAVVEGVGDHGCEYMTGGMVVVLGRTGNNFAAGMTGGTAYVHDVDGVFERRCNRSLVDLEPLDAEDRRAVAALLREHAERTGSEPAALALAAWERAAAEFVKVIPRDYKRALAEGVAREAEVSA
jgi:glutamate synthase domain-containing protein 2/glutamate synthase domain-containing protein 1/glutamate synthase domain-containing protein 3